jgi:hypothetical protein
VVVTGAVLWTPATSFACSGGPSAVNVYKECVPTAGGNKPSGGSPSSSSGSTQGPAISPKAAKALAHAKRQERRHLAHVLKTFGTKQLPASSGSDTAAGEPSPLGSAFDLGSGPTALLIVLVGTAVLLLGGSGYRVWRQRHRA